MCGEKIKFVCKLFRTEHAQISGYPLEYPWYQLTKMSRILRAHIHIKKRVKEAKQHL